MPSFSDNIHIFTDGSIDKNRRGVESLGAAAIVALTMEPVHVDGVVEIRSLRIHSSIGRGENVTNNWAEIFGLVLAAREAEGYQSAAIWSDSKYALGAVCKTNWHLKHKDHRDMVAEVRRIAKESKVNVFDGSRATIPTFGPEDNVIGRWTFLHTRGEKHKRDHTSWWTFFNALADLTAKHSVHVGSGIDFALREGVGRLNLTKMEKLIIGGLFRD